MLIRYRFFTGILFFLLTGHNSFARRIDKEFIAQHLATSVYSIDPEASAVVLLEKRTINIAAKSGQYMQTETVHKIIKILKTDGVKAGDITISVSGDDVDHYVNNINGTTWNLSEGRVSATELEKSDVYRKKINKKHSEVNFSMPAVKEGSVFELSFDVTVPFELHTLTWFIQEEYPKLVTEMELDYPARLDFTVINHVGLQPKDYPSEDDALSGPDCFCLITGTRNYDVLQFSSCWVR